MTTRLEQFLEVYREARVDDQRRYYEQRAKTYQAAHSQVLLLSSIVFGASSAIGLLAGLDVSGNRVWAILAALLPAVTTMLAAYEGLYAFQRLAKLFRDAGRNARLIQSPTLAGGDDDRAAVAKYVADVEQVFTTERGQWGQLAMDVQPEQQER